MLRYAPRTALDRDETMLTMFHLRPFNPMHYFASSDIHLTLSIRHKTVTF